MTGLREILTTAQGENALGENFLGELIFIISQNWNQIFDELVHFKGKCLLVSDPFYKAFEPQSAVREEKKN